MEILLLHGALSTADQLIPLQRELERSAIVHALSFPGHGKSDKTPFTMQHLVAFVKKYVSENFSAPLNIFGYSMGGYAALALAAEYNVNKVITLGTKLAWEVAVAEKEMKMLNPTVIKEKVPAFAQSLEDLHGHDWEELVVNTAAMMRKLGGQPLLNARIYNKIKANAMLMHGEEDKMVSWQETEDASKQIPGAVAVSLPGIPHALEKADPLLLAGKIIEFFKA